MNILFYLTPKCDCTFVQEDDSLRQALERMCGSSYSSVPLLTADGSYAGTLSEGDLLRFIKVDCGLQLDLRDAERIPVSEIKRTRDYSPVSVRADLDAVKRLALTQNFVPVQDDEEKFIGIITRTDLLKNLFSQSDRA